MTGTVGAMLQTDTHQDVTVSRERAALRVQRWYRERENRLNLQEDPPAITFEHLSNASRNHEGLREDLLAEIRFLGHKPRGGRPGERPLDEACRLLELLLQLPIFAEVLGVMPPRARLCAVQELGVLRVEPQDLVCRENEVPGTSRRRTGLPSFQELVGLSASAGAAGGDGDGGKSGGSSGREEGEEEDVACLLLSGESALYIVGPGLLVRTETLVTGSEVALHTVDPSRLPSRLRGKCTLEARAVRGVEVLPLPLSVLIQAAAEEAKRELLRASACRVLHTTAPSCREWEDVAAVRRHLHENVACFQGLPEDALNVICQQASMCTLTRGSCLCQAGDTPDGLRVLLHGYARARQAPPPTTIAGRAARSLQEPSSASMEVGRDRLSSLLFTEFWEDCAVDEWLLCLVKDSRHIFNIVAVDDCEVLFVSRALYLRYMCSSRATQCLGHTTLCTFAALALIRAHHGNAKEPLQSEVRVVRGRAAGGGLAPIGEPVAAEDGSEPSALVLSPALLAASVAMDGLLGSARDVGLPLLRVFPRRVRRQLCSRAKLWRACAGEVLFHEGEPTDSLMIVLRGEVGLFQRGSTPVPEDEGLAQLPVEFFGSLLQLVDRGLWQHGVPRDASGVRWLRSLDSYMEKTRRNAATPMLNKKAKARAYRQLAECLLDVLARHWKGLQEPCRGTAPSMTTPRQFLYSGEMARHLLGGTDRKSFEELDSSRLCGIESVGTLSDFLEAGSSLCVAAVGVPGESPPRRHTAVALGHNTEVLVLEHHAVTEVLCEMCAGLPDGEVVSEVLRARSGPERTPEDIRILDGLISRQEAFEELEHLGRAGICRSMELLEVPDGACVCRQGNKADDFFQVLRGRIKVYVKDKHCFARNGSSGGKAEQGDVGDGTLVLGMGVGSAFGEAAILGDLEAHPGTIRAEGDLMLARIRRQDYGRLGSGWRGEQAARRRALEVLQSKQVSGQCNGADVDALVRVMQDAPCIRDLEPGKCREVVRRAVHVHVPAGVNVSAALREAGIEEQADRQARCLPLCIVLAGCVGQYAHVAEEDEVPQEDVEEAPSPKEGECSITIEERSSGEEAHLLRQQLRQLQISAQGLAPRIAVQPLEASLQDRLHLHFLNHSIRVLQARTADMAMIESPLPPEAGLIGDSRSACTPMAESSVWGGEAHPELAQQRSCARSADASRAATKQAADLSRAATKQALDVTRSATKQALDAEDVPKAAPQLVLPTASAYSELRGSSPSALQVCESVAHVEAWDLPGIGDCRAELFEGETLGGWDDPAAGTSDDPSSESLGAAVFRAHVGTELLVLTQAACEQAIHAYNEEEIAQRVEMLQRCLPSEMTAESIERLAPQFDVEVRPKGAVLLREGCRCGALWLLVEGHCRCSACPGSPLGGLGAAPGAAHDAGAAAENDGGGARAEDAAAPAAGAARGGTPPDPAELAAQAPAAPGAGGGAEGPGERLAPVALGILREGQFVGLSSSLLHAPEPFTVVVSSPQAKLLVMKAESCSRLTPSVLEALRGVARARYEWYLSRSEHIARVPCQNKSRLEQVRDEVQQAQIPRVMDSPFLRRQGQGCPGLAKLEMVCSHFGGEVHPESDWVLAPQSRAFFQEMRLACGSLEGAKSHAQASFGHAAAHSSSDVAVRKFNTFHRLGRKLREESAHQAHGCSVACNAELLPPCGAPGPAPGTELLASKLGVPFPLKASPPPSGPTTDSRQVQQNGVSARPVSMLPEPGVQVKVQSRVYRMAGVDLNVWPGRLEKLQEEMVSGARCRQPSPSKPSSSSGSGPQPFRSKAMQHRSAASADGSPSAGAAPEPPTPRAEASPRRGRRRLTQQQESPEALPSSPSEAEEQAPAPRPPRRPLASLRRSERRTRAAPRRGPFVADETLALGSGAIRRGSPPPPPWLDQRGNRLCLHSARLGRPAPAVGRPSLELAGRSQAPG